MDEFAMTYFDWISQNGPWQYLVTQTFPRSKPLGAHSIDRCVRQLIHRINLARYGRSFTKPHNRSNRGVPRAIVHEYHENGIDIHIHALLRDLPESVIQKVLREWTFSKLHDFTSILPGTQRDTIGYCLKRVHANMEHPPVIDGNLVPYSLGQSCS